MNYQPIQNPEGDPFKKRVRVIVCIAGFCVILLILKLFFLQIIKGEHYRQVAQRRSLKVVTIKAPRGNIYDRRGLLLAGNVPSYTLLIDKKLVKGPEGDKVLKRLAQILGEDFPTLKQEYLIARKKATGEKVLFKTDLDRDLVARIEARRYYMPGIEISVEPKRFYPLGEKAFHFIGYVSRINARELRRLSSKGFEPDDFIGRTGVEAQYEDLLRGKKGRELLEVDALGRVKKIVAKEPPQIGKSLILTVDSVFLEVAYDLLKGKSGAIVVFDPRDGKVLSLVSAPGINPRKFVDKTEKFSIEEWKKINEDVMHPLLNKALLPYHPGSTFKILTAMAGLEEKVISPQKEIFCPGYYRLGRRIFRCWRPWGHGEVDMKKAIEVSCDTYFYQLGELLGIERIAKYARASGFGKLTGIGLPGEKRGLVPDKEWKLRRQGVPWQKGETLNVAIGQGALSVTPLQLAKFLTAVVNDGHLYRPWYVSQILDQYGEVVKEFKPLEEGKLPAHLNTLNFLKDAMVAAVNGKEATGKAAKLKNILVGGKTGTAQVVGMKKRIHSKKLPYLRRDHAWFMAFAPAKNPEIVIVVFVEHGGHGGSAAAPIAGKFLKFYFEGKWPAS
ncbi:penicillin-binding protein 2 [Thermodesulfatator atlanticus]|uniref:penicillin-binding protein 2 n=1 Tax=Thermodesulfatator atlanticus TaxID=501497 RepID=UPI00146EF0FE|nr:penicillin-binding protein 2 [Thermodesulfatator atlanticus]